jgi:hypothetical protein
MSNLWNVSSRVPKRLVASCPRLTVTGIILDRILIFGEPCNAEEDNRPKLKIELARIGWAKPNATVGLDILTLVYL